jgi:hypothetical protein
MATENEAVAMGRFRELSAMTLDEVAIVAATNPEMVLAQVANIEIQRRAAAAQIKAADAQMRAARVQKIAAWRTFALVGAALICAIALITYLEIRSGD